MPKPLHFVCRRDPSPAPGQSELSFGTFPSPTGPIFMAFASESLAAMTALFHGIAANVLVASETDLTPELVGSLTEGRVLVITRPRDYSALSREDPDFPWLDRVITYDFAATLARQARSRRAAP